MDRYATRVMCHDDIRSIRGVYGQKNIRENAKYDDVCRRDFPMNAIQKKFYKFRLILDKILLLLLLSSLVVFFVTVAYLLFRQFRKTEENQTETMVRTKTRTAGFTGHGYLYHDEMT